MIAVLSPAKKLDESPKTSIRELERILTNNVGVTLIILISSQESVYIPT